MSRPNGLRFSPDESKLYIIVASVTPREIHVFDVVDNGTRAREQAHVDHRRARRHARTASACDVDGNLWCGWGMGKEGAGAGVA